MKVEVGTQLRWQGRPVVCTAIATLSEVKVARASGEVIKADMLSLGNVKVLVMEIGQFEAGDIVKFEQQRVELTELGKNLFILYPYYKVRLADDKAESLCSDRSSIAES